MPIERLSDVRQVAKEMASARAELRDGILWVTLTAETSGLEQEDAWWELAVLFDCVSLSDEIRVIVIRGPGDGHAFTTLTGKISGALDRHKVGLGTPAHMLMRAYRNLLGCPQPIIASVNGDAIGAATSLTLHCDIVLAADDVRFGDNHVLLGLNTPVGSYMWPLHANLHRAKEFLFTGQPMAAAEAKELGLVNHVYPAGNLPAETERLARRLAEIDPYAIRWTKKVMNRQIFLQTVEAQGEGLAWQALGQSSRTS